MITNSTEEKLQKIEEYIRAAFKPDFNAGEYWTSGNFDDTFSLGVTQGEQDTIRYLIEILDIKIDGRECGE
jgi:hypothetical protein